MSRPNAEEDEERFDVLDEHGHELGVTETRKRCHAEGIFHRAVYCVVVSNKTGAILLQQRSKEKRISALAWDLSSAEHVSAGEDYLSACVRGLEEELGIKVTKSALQGPICPVHQRRLELPHLAVRDFEYVTTFVLRVEEIALEAFDYNSAEVEALKWVDVQSLKVEMGRDPSSFTPWFLDEAPAILAHLAAYHGQV
jgi:isopentenyldiphosphate isomerase